MLLLLLWTRQFVFVVNVGLVFQIGAPQSVVFFSAYTCIMYIPAAAEAGSSSGRAPTTQTASSASSSHSGRHGVYNIISWLAGRCAFTHSVWFLSASCVTWVRACVVYRTEKKTPALALRKARLWGLHQIMWRWRPICVKQMNKIQSLVVKCERFF